MQSDREGDFDFTDGLSGCKPEEQALVAAMLKKLHMPDVMSEAASEIGWLRPVLEPILGRKSLLDVIGEARDDFIRMTATQRLFNIQQEIARRLDCDLAWIPCDYRACG